MPNSGELWQIALKLVRPAFTLDVSVRTASRELAVVGPSGGGKTTLLRALAGLESQVFGSVTFGGELWQNGSRTAVPAWYRRVGYVPQDSLLFPLMSVRQNLAYTGADADQVASTARSLEVEHLLDRRPRLLSGGERQRVALGRAMLSRPRVLLLDEPFSALDGELRARTIDVVLKFCKTGSVPFVLVSHDERDVAAMTSQVLRLSAGRVL